MSAIIRRFTFSTTSCFAIEFGDTGASGSNPYVRFFTNGQQVESGGNPYEIISPYAAADLDLLHFTQVLDVVYITHPDYPVYKLTRITDTNWTLAAVAFDVPPMLDENTSDTTFTLSAYTGTGVSLAATSPVMSDVHVGSYWRIGYRREVGYLAVALAGDVNSNGYLLKGLIRIVSFGTWDADILLERKNIAGDWEVVRKWHSDGTDDFNIDHEHDAEDLAEFRLTVDNWVSATDARVEMQWPDSIIYGTVKVTAVGSGGDTATVDVVEDLYTQPDWTFATVATPYWSEGAWSAARGYPRACTLHEQRMVYAGTTHQPSTIWGSAVEDFENFERGTNDDDAYTHTFAGKELNQIQWLASLNALIAGSTGSEYRVVGDEYGAIISPTKVSVRQTSFNGSSAVQPETTGHSILYVDKTGRRVREIAWDGQTYANTDLSLLVEHLTESGYITQIAWQHDAKILWCVTSDGSLLGMTYNAEQSVLGWHVQETDGDVKSVATIYGDIGANDEVWGIIERTIGSTTVQYVERMDPTRWTALEDYCGVDASVSYDGSAANSFGGLEHLAGETIVVSADGVPYTGIVVAGDGTFSLPSGVTASVVHAGLAFTSTLSPFRLDTGGNITSTKRIDSLKARVRRSKAFAYNFGGTSQPIKNPEGVAAASMLGATEAVDVQLSPMGPNTTDPDLSITQANPLPLTVLALKIGYRTGSE